MKRKTIKAVVDTNVLISGLISSKGTPSKLLNAWNNKLFTLVISPELVQELEIVLQRPKLAKYAISLQEIEGLITSFKKQQIVVSPHANISFHVRDPKDEMIVTCALRNADYLVTGDKDLLDLRNSPQIRPLVIVTAEEFLKLLEQENRF